MTCYNSVKNGQKIFTDMYVMGMRDTYISTKTAFVLNAFIDHVINWN